MRRDKPSNLNVPNALTVLRLFLIPAVCRLIHEDRMMPALGIFALASLTDVVDGYIARKYQLITDFGKLMDPLSDKLMVMAVMVSLGLKGIAPLAAIVILLIKDSLMLLGGLILYTKKDIVVYSRPVGKVAQFVTVMALILCFFHERFTAWGYPVHVWLLWTGVALSLVALFYYARLNFFPQFRPKDDQAE
ncbi:MAG: CDP-alcohol phosphatidyltransferase family protein [Eubacteriales bacterium]|nr:CDP-alcohol phosphatidyltransferase family protein [Eubacteriales bacterium]